MNRLDHGALNIPGRTSGIDRELDAYKRQQAREGKAKAKADAEARRAAKAEAKALYARYGEAWLGDRVGAERRRLAYMLDQLVKWEPKRAIVMLRAFAADLAEPAPTETP
jgi:hypothetical protein